MNLDLTTAGKVGPFERFFLCSVLHRAGCCLLLLALSYYCKLRDDYATLFG